VTVLLYVVDVQLGLSPGEWRRLYSEQLYGLCCSPVISRVTKWWRMRWVWHVARMGGVFTRKPDHLQVLDFDGRIILTPKRRGRHGTGTQHLGVRKIGQFLQYLKTAALRP